MSDTYAMEQILVIEDNSDIARMLAQSWLPALGYRALVAATATRGRALLAQQPIDLVLVDLQLPDVTDLEHLAAIRQGFPDVPAILMTAHGSERTAVEAFRLGARNYLTKPFTFEQMQQAIEAALRERRLQREKDQLAERLQRRVHELTVLGAIGRSITTVLELDTLLARIVDSAIQLTAAEEGFLLLRARADDQMVVRAAKTLGDERTQVLRLPVEDNIVARVMETRRPVRVARTATEHPVKIKTGYLVGSLLLVPLIARGHTLGVLGVDNVTIPASFNETHERLLLALGDYAAIALENASLLRASQRSEARYRDLFTHGSDVFLVLDQQLRITEVNAAGPRLLGYDAAEFVGQPLRGLTPPDQWPSVLAQLERRVIDGAEVRPFELDLRKRNGDLVRVELSVRVTQDAEGRRMLFCSARDLTERMLLQERTAHAEKLAALEQVVAGVAHELNNPLASITGYTQLLLRDPGIVGEARQDLERVFDQAQRAGQIVQGLLTFGRNSQMTRTSVNLNALVDSTLDLRTTHLWPSNIGLIRDLAPHLPNVLVDPYHLQQVLLNLLNNALRAMEQTGGTLTVRTFCVDDLAHLEINQPASPLPPGMSGRALIVEVRDTGVGIPAHQLRSIFDPFWTTKTNGDGPGLGLSMCHGIITQHGGYIWASSVEGRGTTFTIALPPKKKS